MTMSQDSQRDILAQFKSPPSEPDHRSRAARWAPLVLVAGLIAGTAAVPQFADARMQAGEPECWTRPDREPWCPPNEQNRLRNSAEDRPVASDPVAASTRFVTPATASAGEWIPVLAYRHHGRKGPLEIRFDQKPITFRLTRYAAFTTPHMTELFLTVGVPVTAAPGRHEIQLHEPAAVPGAPPERLAANTITLGP